MTRSLDPQEVELANAHGPYSHGCWTSGGVTIGNEEALSGRAVFLAGLVRREILARFDEAQMREMTLVDVGCYDGWLLCQLEDLPFRRVVGVEPRLKNLEKGRMVRSLLRIETRCEFLQGSIETVGEVLGAEGAEVVICTGLLHHLSSAADGIRRLRRVCRKLLFLETICLQFDADSVALRGALEPKDLPYFFGKTHVGLSGHKYESSYYDGSAAGTAVVSIPSIDALKMFLDTQGFGEIHVVADPGSYSKAVPGGWRQFSGVCMVAEVDDARDDSGEMERWVAAYEGGMLRTTLPYSLCLALYETYCLGKKPLRPGWLARVVKSTVSSTGLRARFWRAALRTQLVDRYALEIVGNLRFAPHDKVALEYGKCLTLAGRFDEAREVLLSITRRLNAYWRSVYRAFCLLAWICRADGDEAGTRRYAELCAVANPQYPAALLSGSVHMLERTKGGGADADARST